MVICRSYGIECVKRKRKCSANQMKDTSIELYISLPPVLCLKGTQMKSYNNLFVAESIRVTFDPNSIH
jgi:hypothetical protein